MPFTDEEYAHTLPMLIPEVIAKSFSIENFENKYSLIKIFSLALALLIYQKNTLT